MHCLLLLLSVEACPANTVNRATAGILSVSSGGGADSLEGGQRERCGSYLLLLAAAGSLHN
jgi:hypothetical protein